MSLKVPHDPGKVTNRNHIKMPRVYKELEKSASRVEEYTVHETKLYKPQLSQAAKAHKVK